MQLSSLLVTRIHHEAEGRPPGRELFSYSGGYWDGRAHVVVVRSGLTIDGSGICLLWPDVNLEVGFSDFVLF